MTAAGAQGVPEAAASATTGTVALVMGVIVLGVGTYGFRLAGTLLQSRYRLPDGVTRLVNRGVIVLLAALVATAAVLQGGEPAGFARITGVVVGGLLAWRRAPFVVVVLAAAGTAAGLRAVGVA